MEVGPAARKAREILQPIGSAVKFPFPRMHHFFPFLSFKSVVIAEIFLDTSLGINPLRSVDSSARGNHFKRLYHLFRLPSLGANA